MADASSSKERLDEYLNSVKLSPEHEELFFTDVENLPIEVSEWDNVAALNEFVELNQDAIQSYQEATDDELLHDEQAMKLYDLVSETVDDLDGNLML